jgi:hypothetical protein
MHGSWSERRLPTLLTIIAALLGAIAIELAVLISPGLPAANAQIPDSGLQRKEMIDALIRTQGKIDDIKDFLRTQVLRVRIVGEDGVRRPAPSSPAPAPARPPGAR